MNLADTFEIVIRDRPWTGALVLAVIVAAIALGLLLLIRRGRRSRKG